MRRALVLAVVAACGGKPPPPAEKPAHQEPPRAHRIPIEDSTHEDDHEDGVTLVTTHGHMEMSAIEAGIKPYAEELTGCYTDKVGRRKWLGGHVTLKWDISRAGEITSVKLAESDLGAHEVEKCLVEVAKKATFAKPIGGDADFTLPLDFSLKGKVDVWDEDKALRAIGGQVAKLDACAKKPAEMPSDVVVTVYVGAMGKAQSVGFSSAKSEINDKWAECAEKAAMAWRLPDPKGQIAKLAVRYRP